jgi:hypothetical protein
MPLLPGQVSTVTPGNWYMGRVSIQQCFRWAEEISDTATWEKIFTQSYGIFCDESQNLTSNSRSVSLAHT